MGISLNTESVIMAVSSQQGPKCILHFFDWVTHRNVNGNNFNLTKIDLKTKVLLHPSDRWGIKKIKIILTLSKLNKMQGCPEL